MEGWAAAAAEAVLVAHALWAVGSMGYALAVWIDAEARWRLTRAPRLRGLHLGGVLGTLACTGAGVVCPLTSLELGWRMGHVGQPEAAWTVGRWLQEWLYQDWSEAGFLAAHAGAAGFTAWLWWSRRIGQEREEG